MGSVLCRSKLECRKNRELDGGWRVKETFGQTSDVVEAKILRPSRPGPLRPQPWRPRPSRLEAWTFEASTLEAWTFEARGLDLRGLNPRGLDV